MADEGFERKLAAILSADVEGYSRLMDDDEEATVRTLTSYRTAISDLVEKFRGRVVDSPGDNILAEFKSVVDSVNCAVEIQRELSEQNEELPDNRKMQFRIGVNLGDVIEEEGRIYGDGVNIAARLEGIADPGGICISRTAFDQIEDKLPLGYEYLGEKSVKNSPKPIRAYKVVFDPSEKKRGTLKRKHKRRDKKGKKRQHRESDKHAVGTRSKELNMNRFYQHRRIYAGVIILLFIINILTWPGLFWFHWPALGWGLFLFIHWVSVSKSSPQKDR
jgi:class 3 adenylate cyclase